VRFGTFFYFSNAKRPNQARDFLLVPRVSRINPHSELFHGVGDGRFLENLPSPTTHSRRVKRRELHSHHGY
jgi:hypothetical protein